MYVPDDAMDVSIGLVVKILKGLWYLITLPFQIHKRKKKAQAEQAAQERITSPPVHQALLSPAPRGVMLGKKNDYCVIKPETLDGHILAVGGAGSGKSSCIAIPSLRGWNARVFAIDIKGELYQTTKEYRPNIMLFNPLDETAYGYDPFYFLKHTNNPVQEARMIAQAIIPLPPDVKDPFWIESAQNIFTGAILHYYSQGLSFIETIQEIQNTPPVDLIDLIFESGTPEAKAHISPFIGMDSKTLYGITAELSRHIVSFATNKDLISCFSRKKSITPDHLERGADIYIQIPEHLLEQWRPLLTLIVNQFLSFFERRSEQNTTPILFLLDEFPRLGKIPAILNGLATLRSRRITICLLLQSLAQLDLIYGTNSRKVISDNCTFKAVFNATDADTQEYFSKLVGTFEKIKSTESEHRKPYVPVTQGSSTSTTTEDKRIIRPEEFATLRDIVLLTPFGFCKANKSPYYANSYDAVTESENYSAAVNNAPGYAELPIQSTPAAIHTPTTYGSTLPVQPSPSVSANYATSKPRGKNIIMLASIALIGLSLITIGLAGLFFLGEKELGLRFSNLIGERGLFILIFGQRNKFVALYMVMITLLSFCFGIFGLINAAKPEKAQRIIIMGSILFTLRIMEVFIGFGF